MKYVPCSESVFRKTSYYCAYDLSCKSKAGIRRVYDTRDNTTCASDVSSCPC